MVKAIFLKPVASFLFIRKVWGLSPRHFYVESCWYPSFSRSHVSRPMACISWSGMSFSNVVLPTSSTLFLKPCQSFLRSKNNVLVQWISDRLVVSTGTRHCIFWEGSSRTRPFHWHLGRSPGVFGSGLLQMPPCISGPGFENRDCTTCCSLGWTGSLLPDIWKVFQTLQQSWPSTETSWVTGLPDKI